MTSNPLYDVTKNLASVAAFQNAKSGPTGNGFFDALRPAIDLLGGAYSAYQGGGQGTLIPGIMNMTQGMSSRNYMKQLQDAAQRDYIDKMNGQIQMGMMGQQASPGNHAFEGVDNNGLPVPRWYGDMASFNAATGIVGNSQTADMYNTSINGGVPKIGPGVPAAQAQTFGQDWQKQVGAVSNFQNSLNQVPGAIKQGQQLSLTAPGSMGELMKSGGKPPTSYTGSGAPLEGALQASVSATAKPQVFNPYFQPSTFDPNVTSVIDKGMGDSQEAGRQGETSKHNRATEGDANADNVREDKRLKAQIEGDYYHNYPPTGGQGGNPLNDIQDSQSILKTQYEAVTEQMKNEGLIDKDGNPVQEGGFLTVGAKQKNATRYNELRTIQQDILKRITGETTQGFQNSNAGAIGGVKSVQQWRKENGL